MPNYIDPTVMKDAPLLVKRLAEDDYSLRVAGRIAGRIIARQVSGGHVVWLWTMTGPYLPTELQPASGDAETLDEAKAAFRAKFDAWLDWASGQGRDASWVTVNSKKRQRRTRRFLLDPSMRLRILSPLSPPDQVAPLWLMGG